MESNFRILAKAVSWQISGLIVMTGVGYAFTGSISQGGALAVATTVIGFACYVIHEKTWTRIRWGMGHPAIHPKRS